IDVDSDQAMVMDVKQTHTGYTLTAKATNDLKKIIFENYGFENLEFRTERDSKGDLIAKPIGILTDHYLMSGESVIKMRGVLYHFIQFRYGDHQIINALVAHDSSTDDARVI